MANYSTLKAAVANVVKTNGVQEITGANLQTVLLSIINSIGGVGYIFKGVATPSTSAGTPDENVFYLAGAGTYDNFGTSVLVPPTNIAVFKYDGTWTCEQVTVESGGVFDISAFNAVGGTLATYADLASALGTNGANIPEGVRKGGMSIKFVQSSDNKYVQYSLVSDTFNTTVANWQGYVNISNYSNADCAIADEEGYAIAIFDRGHIKTKNFDSEELQIEESGIDFAITDKNGKAIGIVKDGFPFTKNFDGEKVAKTSELVSDMKPYKTTIVSIADYDNNLMDVFEAIHPTEENHYVILIPEGTYNVDEWFTTTQIASDSSNFRGVELLNYTKLLGVGCADKIILQWINETYPYRSYISTLNTHEWNELENLTIKAKNIRYAVHDDIWNGLDRHIRVKNCAFIVSGSTTRAWGAGCNGGYDGIFENCKFIMEESTPAPSGTYVEPFVLHDNYYNTRGDSHLTLINCRFVTPYTSYHQPLDHNSWEEVTYNSSYPLYDASKKDYAVNDCVNMPDDTAASYKCLYANTQVMPYGEGRPSLNIGFGAEGATQPLYVTMIGCYLSTYMAVTPTLVRVTGFGNKSGKTPAAILWNESDDSYSTIIDLI